MKMRLRVLISLGLLSLAAAWYFWPSTERSAPVAKKAVAPAAPAAAASAAPTAVATNKAVATAVVTRSAASTNRESFRLANTAKTLGQLTLAPHAILLENALVDTTAKLDLNIPKHLRAAGEPGAFIVQAHGPVDAAFRAALAAAGGQIVSYIPNNAYLVQLSGAGAGVLAGNPLVQAVLPYEPYFKVQATLLDLAVNEKPLPPGKVLTLGLFADGADSTVAQIRKMGGQILGTDRSPFGPVVRVLPSPLENWLALAQLPGVQRVEPATHRQLANDLARVTMGISTDTITNANWLGLSGSNVLVEVNDTGVDAGHPDFSTTGFAGSPGPNPPSRVTGEYVESTTDVDGHGTHVAGIIAGNGGESLSLTNAPSGSVTNADMRGKAPAARLHAFGFLGANDTNVFISDYLLQSIPALTNALISNNSWINGGAFEYDLSAASYDAAVRDALPADTGPQPVLFVFAAGNAGGGEGNGSGGSSDTILSPGTAKNVITVGALEQFRNITNEVVLLDGTTNAVWKDQTDSPDEVAFYSSRGNVGVQTEGTYGRFKPDVVAPGTFVVSTRPVAPMWDMAAYYNPTNYHDEFSLPGVIVTPTQPVFGGASVPNNAVGVIIKVQPNRNSPSPFPTNFPIYFSQFGVPSATNNDFATSNNVLSIPPGGGAFTTIDPLLNNGFSVAVGDPTNTDINFDLLIQIVTTNDAGNTLTVLSNLNETLAPYYYYDSGTSMAAPGVSGALALIQDFFTNTLHSTPSPALLKAMLINGARLTPGYNNFAVTNDINYEGWGLVNVPNSIPATMTNTVAGATNSMFFLDQSPTNVLATGDSRTFTVKVPTQQARNQKLRLTLAWTDPPGNPAAGIKLVNNLDLVVTNNDSGAVYYGNNFIGASTPITVQADSNSVPDAINNVENIWLPEPLGTNYSVTVIGRNVTVNAVTAEQTNIVQDYALVISCGDALNPAGIQVTATPTTPAPVPSTAPVVTLVQSYTNGIYFNQIAGANAPWLSTNAIPLGTNYGIGTNGNFYIGQTNQWHFYIVTNTTSFTNAAFIIFLPHTKASPRMDVFSSFTDNSARPEADLNLLVASEPDANALQLTNLDQTVISNCLYTANGDQASLARGGTKFIAYNNSHLGQVYVIGVQCQDQMAGEYGFLPIFSENPFSSLNPDGSQTVNGLLLPAAIPDGNNRHAGVAYVFALALYPMEVGGVTVTNTISHENFGDLVGALTHGTDFAVLNNHSGLGGPVTNYTAVYNDDGLPGTMGTDGPGSLKDFRKSEAIGPWLLTEVDDAATASGIVNGLTLNIQPHKDLTHGLVMVSVPPGGWWYGYVDVPVGYTNLLVVATNLTMPYVPAIQMYLNETNEPDFTHYLVRADLTNGAPPGNFISYGPPLKPDTYWVGLFNPDLTQSHSVLIGAFLSFDANAITRLNDASTGPVALVDDAVMYDPIFVTNTDLIQGINIGLRVDHPRISDLVFTLISPDNTRYLLMENRGGQSTNGCGVTVVTTNIVNVSATGGSQASTNFINTGLTSGTFPITYNFYTVPDQMTVYYGTNVVPANLVFDTGFTNNPVDPSLPPGPQNTLPTTVLVSLPPAGVPADSTYLTIVINQFGNTNGTAWTYTAGGVITNNYYLTFTEDTNLTTTPIKYAVPPFVPSTNSTAAVVTNVSTVWRSSFEGGTISSTLSAGTIFAEGWQVTSGTVDWLKTGDFGATPYDGNYYIDLNGNGFGSIATNVPTVIGGNYTLTFVYAKNPNAGSTPSAQLSINGSPAAVVAPATLNTWSDLQWATTSVVFTATSTLTPIKFDSLTGGLSGVLLDAMDMQLTDVATNIITQSEDIYYQPEQSLENLLSTSAYGLWQLEILDNRAGMTNNATLVSWQLQFTFANTNITSTISTNLGGTNYIAGGATQWFLIDVPTNADWATNTLIFASLPLQLWWSTNEPPTLTNTTDVQLLANSTGGSSVLGTNTTPAFITPGGHYYLGVQNTNVAGAFYALDVFFHYLAVAPTVTTLPATNLDLTSATLQASVHPGYTAAGVYFEYGLDTNYGFFSTTFDITNNFNFAQLIGIGVTNLLPNTTYYFRAVATNSVGTNYGNILTFFTTPIPYAQTLPATLVSGTNAQLNGFATPNASTLPTSAWFEWGTSATYGNLTPAVSVPNGFTVVYTNAAITNLLKNVAYHFRLVVSNSQAVTYGFDQVLDQANVVAWGANFLGQLNVPAGLSNVVAVAAAYDHSLALKTDGTAVGWGDNAFGQATVPSYVTNAVALAGGEYYSLALKADGTVSAWGASILNQTNVPAGLSNVVYIAGGTYASLALGANGTISAWGANFFSLNVAPAGLSNVVSVAGGGYHNLALINNGTVTAWGDDSTGQTNVPAGLRNVVAIAAGSYHSLALKSDGTVIAWGDNSSGQTNVPAGLTNVVAIAAGGFHSLALRQDGSLVTWGDNSAGQTSVTVGLTNVVAISSGYFHNLALTPQSLSSLTNAFVFSLTNGVAVTNTIAAGATTYYQIDVPTNADLATNTLFYSLNGLLNVWFTTNSPPSLAAAKFLFSGATNGVAVSTVLSPTSAPTNIVPGGTYYLGVQNTNNFAVNYAIGVDFHLVSTNPPPALTNTVPIASIIYTNIGGSNGFLLTWFAPSNDLFQVQWTDSLLPANWQTFTNIISYNTNAPGIPPNAQFNFFDDGSQTGGFGPTRFYRLILLSAATTNTLTLPAQSNLVAVAGSSLTVTNIATDSNTNAILSYSLLNAPAGASITNGIITWTNASPAGLAARFTTIVTDNNSPSLTASNTFTVFVSPFPTITNVVMTATNTTLSWLAPTNDVFQVQWTTNLAPPSWTVFPGNITSTSGTFTFVDTNAPLLMKFYQLILLP